MPARETEKRVRELMDQAVEQGSTAGILLCVRQNGREILYEEAGWADMERKIPIRQDTIFRLYSMTKPITAAAAMILMEQGRLDLGENVSEYLPEFERAYIETENGRRAAEPVMVHQLLQMTSGLGYGSLESSADRKALEYLESCMAGAEAGHPVSTREFAEGIAGLPLLFAPGASWKYGFSADVLGAVIEAASGMPFGKFLEENIFTPLGMKDTGFWVPQEKQNRLASVYETGEDGNLRLYTGNHLMISNTMEAPPAFESGGAGLVSTVGDYARFAQMLMNRGTFEGHRILKPETARFLTSGGLTASQQQAFEMWRGLEGYSYSHFMRVMTWPERASLIGYKGEYGWDGWLGCYFANIPVRGMTILVMQQKKEAGTGSLIRRLRNVILSDLPET